MKDFNLGKYNVGFKYVNITDYSRTYGENFRPVQLFIWYPSIEDSKDLGKFSDYFLINDLNLYTGINDKQRKNVIVDSLIRLEIDDMAFAINHLTRSVEQVNNEKICLISWSVGGVSQAIYCLKNSGIDMFISLDSGIGRAYGVQMLKASPYFDYQKFNIPYFHVTGNQPEMYDVARSSEFYDSIPSQIKHSLILDAFAHQHFPTQIGLIPAIINDDKVKIDTYMEMCKLTRIFIEAYLNEKKSAIDEWLSMIKQY